MKEVLEMEQLKNEIHDEAEDTEQVKYPTASCGALREGEPPLTRLRTRPLSSRQQAGGYSAETFIKSGES